MSAIILQRVCKTYNLYDSPRARLKESLHPLRKKYHTVFHALNDVSLDVPAGQTMGILGVNGAGKSTLLKIITGVTQPSSGTVQVYGKVAALLELGAGFNPELSGSENIFFAGMLMGFSREEMEAKYDSIAGFADIGDYLHQPMKHYSSGMFARLAFALNTSVEPDIFIVDEALAVGDAAFVQKCMRRFHRMKNSGTTILFVTHDATAVKQVCQRAIWLHNGCLRDDGASDKVADHYTRFIHDIPTPEKQDIPPAQMNHTGLDQAESDSRQYQLETEFRGSERCGNQSMQIVGYGTFDQHGNKTVIFSGGSKCSLVMQVMNFFAPSKAGFQAGYVLRNRLGVDIASNSSYAENVDLGCIQQGQTARIELTIELPFLYPGEYSMTPVCGYMHNGDIIQADSLEDNIIITMVSEKKIYVMMSLPTYFRRV